MSAVFLEKLLICGRSSFAWHGYFSVLGRFLRFAWHTQVVRPRWRSNREASDI